MEMYQYQCPVCGFSHRVPAYWVNFSPDPEMQFIHFRMDTKEQCENENLILIQEA
ncbi:MAG: hypothetical protein PHT89_03355 [Lachnospiraceae bacterium]|nr:hypothetical protein [Lachnospiraceae bacterium]MDD3659739.1 hypothetical protein [Lachnospiraceae bacterium]